MKKYDLLSFELIKLKASIKPLGFQNAMYLLLALTCGEQIR